ncbi:unnamed protein product [Rotaria sordida]|uniref:Uncharacterized protein n=1 Tax=Rotaria sordida TaxID=392033 RepID=A0A813V6A9_9BILA|nr:unnamed protein product [Rotaria sordida]
MEQLFSTWFNESDHHYDDDGSELIDYVVEKYDASRSVWQRNVYNDPCKFTYTNAGFAESVAHHFHVYSENCVGMLPTLTTIDSIIAKNDDDTTLRLILDMSMLIYVNLQ